MSYIQYIGIAMVLGLIIGLPLYTTYRRKQLQDITQGKALAVRLNKIGTLWFELCTVENEQVLISKDKEEDAGGVLANAYNTFDTQYPPTLHKVGKAAKASSFLTHLFRPTVSIQAIVIPEGSPIGYIPWIDETNKELVKDMVDRQLVALDDQSGEKMLSNIDKSLNAQNYGGGLKKSDKMWALVIGLVVLLLAGAAAGFGYMNYTEMTSWGW